MSRRRHRHRHRWDQSDIPPRTRRLRRDRQRAKIAGVCAGLARHYGWQPWQVRCIALTGLFFLPSIFFPAYWILFLVMGRRREERAPGTGRQRPGAAASVQSAGREQASSEPLRTSSPRRILRNVQVDLNQTELRLRRMEAHVTSSQYELQKAFQEIDDSSAQRSGAAP